jgi:hypothetical protein
MRAHTCGLLLLLALGLLTCASVGSAENEKLTVVQDESSQERIIEAYLTKVHGLVFEEKWGKEPNDLYLELPFKGDPMPKFRISVDTQPLNRDKDTNAVIERGVLINLYTGVNVPEGKQNAALAILNDFNRRKAFCSAYIDTDGEIVCSWILNILADGLPTEYVYDAVARVQNIWRAIYPVISKEL